MQHRYFVLLFTVLAGWHAPLIPAGAGEPVGNRWWNDSVEQTLIQAKENRTELLAALRRVHRKQRPGMQFLIANMPSSDAHQLTSDFLLENVQLAYEVRSEVAWNGQIPEAIFLNDVLPYASLDEPRDPWRKDFHQRFLKRVKHCRSPGEAAQILNRTIFGELKVRYSTQRRRANQSPKESIEQGRCSCTGLSILLVDACRACGIPARVAGIPSWVNKRGNHTWVEVWDEGWHFTGAAEPDGRGLNHAWFQGDAALARKDSRRHSIYASSFRRTDISFPLVWAPQNRDISAVNVTERYTKPSRPSAGTTRLMIRVLDIDGKTRVAADVKLVDVRKPEAIRQGRSRGETADTNDVLTFLVPRKREFNLTVTSGDQTLTRRIPAVAGEGSAGPGGHFCTGWFRLLHLLHRQGDSHSAQPQPQELAAHRTGLPEGRA